MGAPVAGGGAVLRHADAGTVGRPVAAADGIHGVSRRVAQDDAVAAVGEAVADAAVVGEGMSPGRDGAAAEDDDSPSRRQDRPRWEVESSVRVCVIVAERPAADVDIDVHHVQQLDELVGVRFAHAVAVGVPLVPGGRVGQDLDDEDRRCRASGCVDEGSRPGLGGAPRGERLRDTVDSVVWKQRAVGGVAGKASVVSPAAAVDDVRRVEAGGEQQDAVTTVGEAVADAPVVDEAGPRDPCGRTTSEEDGALSRSQRRRRELEPVGNRRVVVPQSPAADVDGLRARVAQFDELVGVGPSRAVAVGISRSARRRIGENFTDEYGHGVGHEDDGDGVVGPPDAQAGGQRPGFQGGDAHEKGERAQTREPAGRPGHRRGGQRQGRVEGRHLVDENGG